MTTLLVAMAIEPASPLLETLDTVATMTSTILASSTGPLVPYLRDEPQVNRVLVAVAMVLMLFFLAEGVLGFITIRFSERALRLLSRSSRPLRSRR